MSVLNIIPKKFTCYATSRFFFKNAHVVTADVILFRSKPYMKPSLNGFTGTPNNVRSLQQVHYFCNETFKEKPASSTSGNNKSSFQQMLQFRKKQAHRTVLFQLRKKDYIPHALSTCEKFGIVKNAFCYSGVSENVFLLLEFESKESLQQLLLSSCYKNLLDAFPVFSRIIGYESKCEQEEPKTSITVVQEVPIISSKKGTVSDLIENIYTAEKLSELSIRLRFFFCSILKDYLSGLFPFCDAIPFGSSVNGIGKHDSDLDVMIRLYPDKLNMDSELHFVNKTCVGDLQNLQRKVVWCVADILRTFSPGVTSCQKILNARVPIVKLDHKVLGMKIDISVNNMAPVFMSELLHFCGEVDYRFRPLIYAVKKWARETSVTYDTPGSWITNFALSLLVIFFLQNRPLPILPPLCETIRIMGTDCSTVYRLEYLMSLSEMRVKSSLNKESLAVLLKEFLTFLGSHPFENKFISVLSGIAIEKKTDYAIWLQYPFEEDANVSKNVSEYELWDMCEKARVSARYLSTNLSSKGAHSKDLSVLLGIPNIRKLDASKSKKLDVSSLFDDEQSKNVNKNGRHKSSLKNM